MTKWYYLHKKKIIMKRILHIDPQLNIIWWMERYIEQFYISFCDKYEILALGMEKTGSNINIPKENIFSLNEEIKDSIIEKIKKLFFRSKNIAYFCNEKQIDFSISHGDVANIFNILSKFFWNKSKIIIIFHNAFDIKVLWTPLYYLCKFFYKFADEIISVSYELSNDVKKQINSNQIKTIYNPFDFDKIEILKNEAMEIDIEKILNNWKINICNVARLDPNKKQDLLLECFADFYKTNKNIQLFFIWNWAENYKKSLEKIVDTLWINGAVYFLWHKENVYKYIRKMDYYYYSGLQEWFGRWLVDALSLWVPILTHDYKYWAKEIIRNNLDFSSCKKIEIHENGILTPYMNKEKYITWMNLLLNTKFDKEKIIQNTRKYGIDNFKKSWNLLLKWNYVSSENINHYPCL